MKHLVMALLSHLLKGMLAPYVRLVLKLLQIEAAARLVRVVQMVRMLFLGWLALCLMVVLAMAGLVLAHVGLYLLLPFPANAITLLALGVFYLLLAGLVLAWACSGRTWMKYSKAGSMVESALGHKGPEGK